MKRILIAGRQPPHREVVHRQVATRPSRDGPSEGVSRRAQSAHKLPQRGLFNFFQNTALSSSADRGRHATVPAATLDLGSPTCRSPVKVPQASSALSSLSYDGGLLVVPGPESALRESDGRPACLHGRIVPVNPTNSVQSAESSRLLFDDAQQGHYGAFSGDVAAVTAQVDTQDSQREEATLQRIVAQTSE